MGTIREFLPADSSRIWEHLNHIRDQSNPQIYTSGTYNLAASNGTLNGGTAAWGGFAFLTRTGSMVTLSLGTSVAAGSVFVGTAVTSTVQILQIPTGYRPASRAYSAALGAVFIQGPNQYGFATYNPSTNRLQVAGLGGATYNAGHLILGELAWRTNEAAPATTPGAPS